MTRGNRLESSAAAYTGLIATLLLAPLAFARRADLSRNMMWIVLIVITMSWALNLPGFVSIWRTSGLNMLSFNRFVFVTSFAILSLAAVGLDQLWLGRVRRHAWFVVPLILVIGLGAWSLNRSINLPEPLASAWATTIEQGEHSGQLTSLDELHAARVHFNRSHLFVTGLCLVTAAGWLTVLFHGLTGSVRHWLGPVVGALMLLDLYWYAHGVNPQCDRKLYFPPLPILQQLADCPPGRILGYQCLPARLAEANGLRDLRGYDAVDPRRLMELMFLAHKPGGKLAPYALTQWYVPRVSIAGDGVIHLHPVLDMLNVRYVVFRGNPPSPLRAFLEGNDYWVLRNPRALPRLFVPRRVEVIRDDRARLRRIASSAFDALEVGLVEQPVDLPAECHGTANLQRELPSEVVVQAQMETPGLLVMSDLWDAGWKAAVNGREVEILRTNHALRGIVLPAGESQVAFTYAPAGFLWGLCAMAGSLLVVGFCSGFVACCRDR